MRKRDCTNCCARWFVTVDGSECLGPTNASNIETTIYASSAYSIFFPTSMTGVCSDATRAPIGE